MPTNHPNPLNQVDAEPAYAGKTRLAPSPTGALHLGNARTFLVNWALARQHGHRIVLRIEDLDGPRIKPGAAAGIVETLAWLGMDWDEGPLVQSDDLQPYRAALTSLAAQGLVYQCDLTRQQIEAAASAPQEGSHEVRFPAELRPASFVAGAACPAPDPLRLAEEADSWRFAVQPGAVEFVDDFAGPQSILPVATIGDFVVWTKRGTPAYQLAVVVDDARQGVTHIVRGDDLLDSAARQLLLYRALRLAPEPRYCHLPLVLGQDGKRLAKRHGDTRVETYRALGVHAEAIIGLVARWCGIGTDRAEPAPMSAAEFRSRLRLNTIPRSPAIFTPEDDLWLRRQR